MQKFITVLLIGFSLSVSAQVTITSSDMPAANDTIRWSNTFDQWGIDATETGANYFWDFGFLTANSQTLDTCFAVTTTPFPYQFFFNNQLLYPAHKATYAMRGADFDLFGIFSMTEVFNYYKVNSGEFANVGFGANINGIPASIRNEPVDSIYAFPLNYLDSLRSNGNWVMEVPNTFTYGQSTDRYMEVIGWGTLITPLDTFQTLKIKMDITITDTLAIDSLGINFSFPRPMVTEYHWLSPGRNFPLLQINTSFGIITAIKYQDSLRSLVGVEETTLTAPLIYPNPANDRIFINTEMNSLIESVSVYDMAGKQVLYQYCAESPMAILNVDGLSNGIYLLVGNTDKGIFRSKFNISR